MQLFGKLSATVLMVLSLIATGADAGQSVRMQQYSYKKKLGPWHLVKQSWEDGTSGCVASSYHNRTSFPSFSFAAYETDGKVNSTVRFDVKGKAKPDGEAKVRIHGQDFIFFHPAKYDHGGYFPRTGKQLVQVLKALVQLENASTPNKSFHVTVDGGRTYKFDARKTEEVLDYLRNECGFAF